MSKLINDTKKLLKQLESKQQIKEWEAIIVRDNEINNLSLSSDKNWIVIETYGTA